MTKRKGTIRLYRTTQRATVYGKRLLATHPEKLTGFQVVPHPGDFGFAIRIYAKGGRSALVGA